MYPLLKSTKKFPRYEFMSAQVNDVEKSKKEIEKLITDLTKQMKEVFVESFDQINKNFTYTFKELFGGGTASLSLADPGKYSDKRN